MDAAPEPSSLPPSETLEPLPDDFWTPEAAPGEPPEAVPAAAAAAPATPPEPAAAGASAGAVRAAPGDGIAMLQRLFPGRVLAIEPHPDGAGGADDERPTPAATGDESDEADAEPGLESR